MHIVIFENLEIFSNTATANFLDEIERMGQEIIAKIQSKIEGMEKREILAPRETPMIENLMEFLNLNEMIGMV